MGILDNPMNYEKNEIKVPDYLCGHVKVFLVLLIFIGKWGSIG